MMAKPFFQRSWLLPAAVLFMAVSLVVITAMVRKQGATAAQRGGGGRTAPVEVAAIVEGPIEWRRTFSGALVADSEFTVAPKVGGTVKMIAVDIGDRVRRGQVVAQLNDDEFVQAVAQAEAELAVADANLAEASSALEIARREIQRITALWERGLTSESQFDLSRADELAKQSRVEVSRAQVIRARSALESARIRLSYTQVTADWSEGSNERLVGERYIHVGQNISPNQPLMLIISLDPITGIIFVTEREYSRLAPGQLAILNTDAFPGEVFRGRISRIAPVFREDTRQARVELTLENPGHRLKPGMFIRATVTLARIEDATIVPEDAITLRGDRTGVFLVNPDGRTVSWRPVTVGIRDSGQVEVSGEGLRGRVVTLGQHLLDDGSPITIPLETESSAIDQGAARS